MKRPLLLTAALLAGILAVPAQGLADSGRTDGFYRPGTRGCR